MNTIDFRLPVRTSAALALTLGSLTLATPVPAYATGGGEGRASAVVLRTGLDVSLLNKTIEVPLKTTLNEVRAPAGSRTARETALEVKLDGVEKGQPVSVLKADVATATATVAADRAEGATHLLHARLHVPGLPLLSLVEVQDVTAKAVCAAGARPVASSNLLGAVTVLGKKLTLTTGGTTRVAVPGVGEVTLDLSSSRTTSRTAAATALRLKVSVNPLKLNVAEVEGEVTLAEATCETPRPLSRTSSTSVRPQTLAADPELAETGGGGPTRYVIGGAAALLAAGGVAVTRARRG
ncbi:SCO1860 family LAETG-anchored protein [Streptomyces sp. BPTC-684]|uniref:SCO1860 family LAETG-anchored protein n=1 Tax=Streptomyces sp. BPTC-684 TaxID=3043734 RepID=UPI0024B1D6F8|nr:SCO1860 family LAETG-anchored protein [Streptomyces sp. BPTC-684]WHM39336.1 SCO1860 family LAETG-anchored protein [Streptomyces sp. BPTC-684]